MIVDDPTFNTLKAWYAECPGALIAFSGGVDSSLVAYLARQFLGNDRCLAVISASSSLKLSDLDGAKDFCATNDIPLRVIRTLELMNPHYFNNPTNRCYFCKTTLYHDIEKLLPEFPDYWILNGTNTDDLGDHRPGLQAATEHRVRSPLTECQVDKQTVRDLAQALELSCWSKPASPCLSSRIPYGERVTEEKLRRIEQAEDWLQQQGFDVCRVRHAGEIARIEVPADQQDRLPPLEELQKIMQSFGFTDAEVDLEGFVSGKLNRVLP